MAWRVGIDTGGTFTDFVLLDEETGEVQSAKVPSTPADPAQAFVEGLASLLVRARVAPAALTSVTHGTTVATNALLERKGARTGLLTTAGFRDVLEIRRHVRGPGRIYDLFFVPPAPLVERERRLDIRERLDARGHALVPLDLDAAREQVRALAAAGVEAIAVAFLHAYQNGAHEAAVKALIEREHPGLFVSISSDISPEIREYERTSTTVINAYLQPVVARYVGALEARLLREGVRAPLRIMQSNGGVISAPQAATRPVQLVASGPAGGAIGGMAVGQATGFTDVITLDVGGTSCDICLIEQTPRLTNLKEVDGNPIRVPTFDLHVIGAGGGSIAWIDDGGALRVGPRSAGAEPGPACYRRGGTEPTVTDANVVLGRLDPDYFLGGAMKLDPRAARAAVEARVAGRFGLGVEAAAAGILRVVNATMAENIKIVSVRRGWDPRDFALVAFGGAGPTHASALMAELRVPAVLVPPVPGTLSALGLLATDVRHDFAATYLRRTVPARGNSGSDASLRQPGAHALTSPGESALAGEIAAIYAQLEARGRAALVADGVQPGAITLTRSADVRYAGQAYEVGVPADGAADVEELRRRFHAEHERLYAHSSPEAAVELVTLRVAALGRLPRPVVREIAAAGPMASPDALKGRRPVWFDEAGGWVDCPIWTRHALGAGNRLEGPAIVEQMDTTTVLLPGQTLTVHPIGTLVIRDHGGG
jgi:N-methylhydantoinase A